MAKRGKEMQTTESRDVPPAEQTRPGRVLVPPVDIFETPDALTLLADMPGVKPERLKIDLRDSVLTLSGAVEQLTEERGEDLILAEYEAGGYYRQFTLSEHIDQGRIEAKLADGVLTLRLPKVEAVKPRQITVKAG